MTHAMKLCSTYGDHIVPSITTDGTIIMCEEKDSSLSVSTRWWDTDDYKYVVIGAKLYPPNNDNNSSSLTPYWSTLPVSLDFTVEGDNNNTRFSRSRGMTNCAINDGPRRLRVDVAGVPCTFAPSTLQYPVRTVSQADYAVLVFDRLCATLHSTAHYLWSLCMHYNNSQSDLGTLLAYVKTETETRAVPLSKKPTT
jgi:hypothetical protein